MNLVWTGSDVIYATSFPKKFRKIKYFYCLAMRIFAYIADFLMQKHIVVSSHLVEELSPLNLRKPIEVRENPVIYKQRYPRIPHPGFNVLYYHPMTKNQVFTDWLYGYDIICDLEKQMPHIIFIGVDGSADMAEVFPVIDFYARPNRHDGCPRLVRECEIQQIPYYHSYKDPSFEDLKNQIQLCYDKIFSKNHQVRPD